MVISKKNWMIFPDGYSEYLKWKGLIYDPDLYCVELLKAMYGLVQAARQWFKKFKGVMAKCGYHSSGADPCLFIKHLPDKTFSFVMLYVDDGGIIGSQKPSTSS